MIRFLTTTALLSTLASAAFAAPFTNGAFLNPSISSGSFVTVGSAPDTTTVPNWTVKDVDYIITYWQAPTGGGRSIDMNGSFAQGTISQTFDTVMGKNYTVTFELAGNPDGGPTVKTLGATAPGYSGTFTFDITGYNKSNMGWTTESFGFTASGISSTISFIGDASLLGPSSVTAFGPAIGNVNVREVTGGSVPEPATLALLGAGLLGLGMARRKRG